MPALRPRASAARAIARAMAAALAAAAATAVLAAMLPPAAAQTHVKTKGRFRVYTRGELASRQDSQSFQPTDANQEPAVQDALQGNYVQAAQAADAIPGVQTGANGNLANVPGQLIQQDGQQYQWNNDIPVTQDPSASGSEQSGWQGLPQVQGFTLNDTFRVTNRFGNESAIFPYYIAVDDPATVKRFIVVLPGKPRDVWNYANFMLNARNIPVIQGGKGIKPWADWKLTNASVGIVAPAFLNMQDLQAGACKSDWLCFNNSYWQQGGTNKNPEMQHSISSFLALDQLLDQLFLNTTFPALSQVVVAGHSLGGQGAQRYAVLKKTKAYDPNVRYWIGNPGSYAYVSSQRPDYNASAADTFDQWPYGIHQNTSKVPSYARRDVVAQNGTLVAERYRNRTVGYGLALMDVGAGVTAAPAMAQGYNHLDRGAKFVMSLGNDFPDGFPKTHTVDFIANMTHQDYGMYTANMSLQRLFWDGPAEPNPWLTNVTNPGDKPHHHHHHQHHNHTNTTGHTNHTNGTHTFATPKHKTMARSLLGGSCGAVALCFFLLPFLYPANYSPAWEEEPVRKS